jgi:hypothetical protein
MYGRGFKLHGRQIVWRELSEQIRGKGLRRGNWRGLAGKRFLKNARVVPPGYGFFRIASACGMQGVAKGVGGVPLVKGRINGRFLPAVNVALKQVLRRMGYVEECRLLPRKSIDEKLSAKFGPLDMGEFFNEGIDGGRARDIVKSINSERGYKSLSEVTICSWDDRIEAASPEDM